MADSILDSVKNVLGVSVDYDIFDTQIIMHINTAFNTLTQLGIGPTDGFMIQDEGATWDDFLGDTGTRYNSAKTYVYLKVRLLFDPPTTSYLLDAMGKQVEELEWRMNVERERTDWVDPNPPTDVTT